MADFELYSGGAGAPAAQPAPGAAADPVTMIQVTTVVDGVTQTIQKPFTQTFGGAKGSAPPVQTGSIGMGTLTGQVGVVKTKNAKSEATTMGRMYGLQEMAVLSISGICVIIGGLFGLAML